MDETRHKRTTEEEDEDEDDDDDDDDDEEGGEGKEELNESHEIKTRGEDFVCADQKQNIKAEYDSSKAQRVYGFIS